MSFSGTILMDFQRRIIRLIRMSVPGFVALAASLLHASGLAPISEHAAKQHPFASVGQVTAASGEQASGTLIADRLVLTSAAAFIEQLDEAARGSSFSWIWKAEGESAARRYEVARVHVFDNFINSARRSDVSASSVLRRSLLVVELRNPVEGISVATNVETISGNAYRMVVGYAADRYESRDARIAQLHATQSGEAVYARFGRVEGRLYQTGDLKAAQGALGGPVLSFYDGQWSIDGIVVASDEASGECFVLGLDRTAADFIESTITSSNAVVQTPDESVSAQDSNGTAEGAIPLAFGTGHSFSIAPEADADFHQFTVEQESEIVIESFGDLDVSGRLLNAAQQLIVSDDDGGSGFNYRMETLLTPGTYYLLTTPYSGAVTGDYGISLRNLGSTSSFLDDGFISTMVQDLQLETETGNYRIAKSGEVDWFRVVVADPGHFILQTTGDLDVKARIFRPRDGSSAPFRDSDIIETLDVNDDFPGRQGNAVLDVFLSTGTYIVAVEARNAGEFGPYGIGTRFYSETLPVVNAGDGIDGFATASLWTPGEVLESSFEKSGDRDTYRLQLDRTTELDLTVTSTTDVAWFLYDASLRQVATSGVALVDPTIQRTLSAGTYYLMIAGFAEHPYSIQ